MSQTFSDPGPKPKRTIGIVWFNNEEEHKALKAMCTDLHGDYATWKEEAEHAFSLDHDPYVAVKIKIEPEKFKSWCEAQHRPTDQDARRHYVGIITAAADKKHLQIWKQKRDAWKNAQRKAKKNKKPVAK